MLNTTGNNRKKATAVPLLGGVLKREKKTDTGQKLNPEYIESEHKKSN